MARDKAITALQGYDGPPLDVGRRDELYQDWKPPDQNLRRVAQGGAGNAFQEDDEHRRAFNQLGSWDKVEQFLDKKNLADAKYWQREYDGYVVEAGNDVADFIERMQKVGVAQEIIEQIKALHQEDDPKTGAPAREYKRDTENHDIWRMYFMEDEPV